MGKSPRGLFGPKHCGGKQAARVGWAPSRTLSEPPSEVQRTSAGWTLGLQGGVVGGCENEERARRSMRGSQLAGKDEMVDEKKPATSTATWLTPSRTNLWASHVPRRPRRPIVISNGSLTDSSDSCNLLCFHVSSHGYKLLFCSWRNVSIRQNC